jgi:hypothetical protein
MWRVTSIALLCAAATVTAAPQGQEAGSAGQSKTATSTALSGCLRAGPGRDAFVLVTGDSPAAPQSPATSGSGSQPAGTSGQAPLKTVTYQLVPGEPGVDLKQFVGQRVSVTGRLDPGSKTTVATNASAAAEAKTDATPRDQTTPVVTTTEATRVQAQRMQVASISPAGGSCPQ